MPDVIGAIRWDAYYANNGPGLYTRRALSAPGYRDRTPLHAVLSDKVITYAPTQETMDAEISAAVASNLSYWAFLRYAPGSVMNYGFNIYQTSNIKTSMPYCWITYIEYLGSTGAYSTAIAEIVARMQDTNWIKVLANRPLFYIMWNDTTFSSAWGGSLVNLKAAVDALRTAAIGAGLGTPYIVVLHAGSTLTVAQQMTGIGSDAASAYIAENIPTKLSAPYVGLDTATRAFWAAQAGQAGFVVPICMAGWDRRPRIQRPVQWEMTNQLPQVGHLRYTTPPTPAEFATHIQAARSYISANPVACPAKVALIYAWNEFDEGGYICPSNDGKGQAMLSALAPVLAS